jgi:drug/metabolite transporter (DMT)-like permease
MADVDTTRARVDPERAGASAKARPGESDDWAVQTADSIERLIDSVRSNTSDRLVSVARLVVFGLLAAILGTIGLVLFTIFAVRILDSYIPGGVWVVYLILGVIFAVLGLYLWSRAWKRPAHEH